MKEYSVGTPWENHDGVFQSPSILLVTKTARTQECYFIVHSKDAADSSVNLMLGHKGYQSIKQTNLLLYIRPIWPIK